MSNSTRLPGARIGKYRILAHIATGGMGTVYKARDEELGRVVALKVLAPELSSNAVLVERFRREARHAARLSHKNIVTLYECGQADGLHYLAMEFIEGIDLSEYIRRKGKLPPEEARLILIQACKALEHAYAQGVTHRDIKPSNFLLANEEGRCRVKLTDLGLARMENEEDFRVTRDGTTVGTVDYMAPEQARDSSAADIRSDIYSLGCTFYQMLAGQPPFADGGIGERVYKHIASDPPDIRELNPRVPASLWTVMRRMLAKHPDDRFQTPTELIQALRSLSEPTQSRPAEEEDSDSSEDMDLAPSPPSPPSPPEERPRPPSPAEVTAARPDLSPPRKISRRRKPVAELQSPLEDANDALGITAEQRKAAAGQFARASELAEEEGGDPQYALGLLLSCCKLDPTNVEYRKLLREVVRKQVGPQQTGIWSGLKSLTNLRAKSRFKSAKRAGEHRQVLDEGEELLTRIPGDISIQVDMAEAAEALNLTALAGWLLEEARRGAPEDLHVLRPLADLYERHEKHAQAIAVWEKIREIDPYNTNAASKIKDLAAAETIARSRSRR